MITFLKEPENDDHESIKITVPNDTPFDDLRDTFERFALGMGYHYQTIYEDEEPK